MCSKHAVSFPNIPLYMKNPSAQPNNWKKDGAIFAIQHKGNDYFPIYALDAEENYRPYKAFAEVLLIFGETKTGWESPSGLRA